MTVAFGTMRRGGETARPRPAGRSKLGLACLAVACVACTGSSPTDPPLSGSRRPDLPLVTSLAISAPPTLIVHEKQLLTVAARSARGVVVPVHDLVVWDSSNDSIASVSSAGVIVAHERGTVTIGATSGAVHAEVTVTVKARVRISPELRPRECGPCYTRPVVLVGWPLQPGDSLDLTASFVDVDGIPLVPPSSIFWSSDRPDAVSVSQEGRVVALAPATSVRIWASSSAGDERDSVLIQVWDTVAGSVTLRLAHAAAGMGPLTFVHNKGAAVVLEFGESVDTQVSAGVFYVAVEGVPLDGSWTSEPLDFTSLNRDGDRLSVFVVGGVCCGDAANADAGLVAAWGGGPAVAPDSARVRLIQGWNAAPVVYVLPHGAPADGLPTLCYFDPGDTWSATLPVGDLDFVLEGKYGLSYEPVRVGVSPPPAQSITYVITQGRDEPPGVIGFPDP